MFEFAQGSIGHSVAEENFFSHLLDINSEIRQGILQIFWSYSRTHYQSETIEIVAQTFINRLKQLIHYCSQDHNFGYTPSDFGLVDSDEVMAVHRLIQQK